ncbi:MAG: hypothetical protein P8Z50_02305 [candidate division WOR-3 bacterium]
MSDRITVWGIGIKFTVLSLGYSFAIMFIHYFTYPLFDIGFLKYRELLISGLFFVMYVFFRILIKEEEDYLSGRFRTEYEKYKREVSLIFPKIWRYEK